MSWLQSLKNKTKSKQSLASLGGSGGGGEDGQAPHRPQSPTAVGTIDSTKVTPDLSPLSPGPKTISSPRLVTVQLPGTPPGIAPPTIAASKADLNIKLKAIYPTQSQSPLSSATSDAQSDASSRRSGSQKRSAVIHMRAIEGRSIAIPSSVLSTISADKNPVVRPSSNSNSPNAQPYLYFNPYIVISYDRNEIVVNSSQGTLTAPVWRHKATFDLTHDTDATFSVYIRTAPYDPTAQPSSPSASATSPASVASQPAGSRTSICSADVLLGTYILDHRTIQDSQQQTVDQWFTLTHPSHSSATGQVHMQISIKQAKSTIGIEDFDLLTVVGKGSFGKVMQVKKKDTGRVYAMKILKKSHLISKDEVSHTLSERNVLRQLQHPFIVNLKFAFQNEHKLYFVLPFINGGELFKHLSNEERFSEERARFYAAELATALEFLHSYNIIYRDLKPENILLDFSGHIALCDFGLCKLNMGEGARTNTFCGTPEYLAGEVLLGNGYTKAVDWWTLGILLYEMLTGLPPFYDENVNEMYRKILYAPLVWPPAISPTARSLLSGLIDRDPERRIGAAEVKAHPFFASIDWVQLVARKVTPPFKPVVENSLDTSNFDEEFTKEIPCDSIVEDSVLSQTLQGQFRGFTYIPGSELSGTMQNPSPVAGSK
ncbi:Serine/threonine-protein kinase [Sorochytrium milnesiophthora]